MATLCEWSGDVTHPCHLFLQDGAGQISWCQECYWQFPLFLGSCPCSKLGKLARQNLGRKQVSAAEQKHNSVSCLEVFWCFWGHQNIEQPAAESCHLLSLVALQLITVSPEVWQGVNRTSQALISAVHGSGEHAHVADRAARAVCVSNGVLRAEGILAPCPCPTRMFAIDWHLTQLLEYPLVTWNPPAHDTGTFRADIAFLRREESGQAVSGAAFTARSWGWQLSPSDKLVPEI